MAGSREAVAAERAQELPGGLAVEVLGGLRVTVDGRARDLHGGLRRRLLLCLVAAGERPLTTDRVADALWGDRHGGRSANAVQAHVSRLRKLLDPGGDRGGRWLLSLPEGYVLRPDHLDIAALEADIAAAEARVGADPVRALEDLGAAFAQWKPPVVEDLPAWAALYHRLEVRRLGAEDTWADLAARLGTVADVDRVVDLARAEPTRELRWALAMHGLSRTGRQTESLALYGEARRLLRDEYGIDPGRELRAMHESVLQQDLDVPVGSVESGPTPDLVAPPVAVTSFVGRVEELAALEAAVAGSRVVTVIGLGGIGKSRLVAEWIARSGRTGSAHWVDLRAVPAGPPGSPSQVLERIAATLGVEADSERTAREAVVGGLPTLPTVLVLDNTEHVLDDVAAVVTTLVERLPRLTVVSTSRASLGVPGERVLALTPLAVDAEDGGPGPALELAAARLEPFASRARIAEVAARSGGLPLAIELLAGGPDPHDQPDSAEERRIGPVDLAEIAERAVDELAPDTARLFLALLDLPDGASSELVDHLGGLTGVGPARRARQLRELVGASLVVTAPVTAHGRTGVRHRVLQPIADLREWWSTPEVEADNQVAVAQWLRTHVPGGWADPPDRPALAALLGESRTWARTFDWYAVHRPGELLPLVTALHPFLRWAGHTVSGAHWLTRGLELAGAEADPVEHARALVLRTQGQGLGHTAQGLTDLTEAVRLFESAGIDSGPQWAVAQALRAVAVGWTGGVGGFDELMTRARAAVPAEHRWFHLQTDLGIALSHVLRGTPTEGLTIARRAALELRELDDPDSAAVAIHYGIQLATVAGLGPDEMGRLFAEAEDLGADAQPHARALLAGSRAQHALRSGARDAVPVLLEAIRLTEQTGNLRTAAVGRRDLGLLHLREGRAARARHQLLIATPRLLALDTRAATPALAGLAGLTEQPTARATLAEAAWVLAGTPGGSVLSSEGQGLITVLLGSPPGDLPDRETALAAARAALEQAATSDWRTPSEAQQPIELEQHEGRVRGR